MFVTAPALDFTASMSFFCSWEEKVLGRHLVFIDHAMAQRSVCVCKLGTDSDSMHPWSYDPQSMHVYPGNACRSSLARSRWEGVQPASAWELCDQFNFTAAEIRLSAPAGDMQVNLSE